MRVASQQIASVAQMIASRRTSISQQAGASWVDSSQKGIKFSGLDHHDLQPLSPLKSCMSYKIICFSFIAAYFSFFAYRLLATNETNSSYNSNEHEDMALSSV